MRILRNAQCDDYTELTQNELTPVSKANQTKPVCLTDNVCILKNKRRKVVEVLVIKYVPKHYKLR